MTIKHSPWGAVQHQYDILPGMSMVSTAGHGGVFIDAARYDKMPSFMKSTGYSSNGWYEEDCDWCLPFVVFAEEILASGTDEHAKETIRKGQHMETFASWHAERHAKWMKAQEVAA